MALSLGFAHLSKSLKLSMRFWQSQVTFIKKKKNKKKYEYKKIENIDYYFIKNINYRSNFSLQRVLSWFYFEYHVVSFNFNKIKFKPDIIYISSPSLLTILSGIFLKKKFKAKLVFEMRDLWPYFLYTTGKFSKFNPLICILGLIEKIGINFSDLIIGSVPRIKQYIEFRGFFNKKTLASTFPVNTKLFKKKKNIIKLDKKKFNLCYAGNFGFDNHLEVLLNLISKIQNKNLAFYFFGDGSLKKYIKEKFSHLPNVFFYKKLNYLDLHSVLTEMNCLLVSFGLGNKYPIFGYELNKLNNYLMAEKPILALGSQKNLSLSRGRFIFLTKNNPSDFEKKIYFIKNNYKSYLRVASLNKKKLFFRNNASKLFKDTARKIEQL